MSNATLLANYLQAVLENPVALVPYNPEALSALVRLCKEPNVSASGLFAAMGLAGPQSSQGWDTVQAGPFLFPQEHGPHWGIRNAWYYVACNLTYQDASGTAQPLNVLLAIIRRGTTPPTSAAFNQYPKNQTQIVACEATVEMPGEYLTAAVAMDGFTSSLQFQAPSGSNPFLWTAFDGKQLFGLNGSGPNSMLPMNCGLAFTSADGKTVTAQLTLTTDANPPFFLQGQQGCAPCIDGLGYRYYSWPALQVTGTVTVDGKVYTCTGNGWLDHQWGARMQPLGYVDNLYLRAVAILSGSYPKVIAPQWDWFFMHLSNGMHITTAVLPSAGFLSPNPMPLTNTTVVTVDPSTKALSINTFQGGSVVYGGWVEVNCNMYASTWELTLPGMVLKVQATLPPPSGVSTGVDGQTFMEKGTTVTGTVNGVAVTGVGFAEAIGYDRMDRQVVNMLSPLTASATGLIDVQALVPLFFPASPTAGQVALASLLVIGPPVLLLIIILVVVTVVVVKKKRAKREKAAR